MKNKQKEITPTEPQPQVWQHGTYTITFWPQRARFHVSLDGRGADYSEDGYVSLDAAKAAIDRKLEAKKTAKAARDSFKPFRVLELIDEGYDELMKVRIMDIVDRKYTPAVRFQKGYYTYFAREVGKRTAKAVSDYYDFYALSQMKTLQAFCAKHNALSVKRRALDKEEEQLDREQSALRGIKLSDVDTTIIDV